MCTGIYLGLLPFLIGLPCLPGATDKWLPEWFRDMQKLRQALLNFPCHEKNPVKIVPWSIVEWNAVCLNTPLVILAHLSLALDGTHPAPSQVRKVW